MDKIIRGTAWVLGHNIDTDLIYPGAAFQLPIEEQARLVLSGIRPGWVDQVRRGDILVAGRNFGTGSARPGAMLLKYIGLAAVVADSISGTFFRNSVNYGFPAIQCAGVSDVFQDRDVAEIDLQKFEVRNLTRSRTLQAIRLPQQIMAILEAEGIVPLLRKEGYLS